QAGLQSKHPRHIYANPLAPEICPILSLGIFWMSYGLNSDISMRLFTGRHQYDRHVYSKVLKRVVQSQAGNVRLLGGKPDEIGAHSSRKGAASWVSSGSSACPSSTAVSLRAGWVQPGVEDTYKRFEAAGDQYLGRCCAGETSITHQHIEDFNLNRV
ncbi:hypothetical protein JKP88DRAFT_177289, partial [Tribonema minus]